MKMIKKLMEELEYDEPQQTFEEFKRKEKKAKEPRFNARKTRRIAMVKKWKGQ